LGETIDEVKSEQVAILSKRAKSHGTHTTRALASLSPREQFESLAVGESGTDSLIYTVSDGNGGSNTATVTVTIDGVNDSPTAEADSFTTDEDNTLTTGNVLDNDNDPDDSDTLSVSAINTDNTQGQVTDNGDGTFEYNPNGQFEDLNKESNSLSI
jgi:VCBS repeat-containing protein